MTFNDAESQQSGFDLIPKGTIVPVRMTIKPGGYDDPSQGWGGRLRHRSFDTGSIYFPPNSGHRWRRTPNARCGATSACIPRRDRPGARWGAASSAPRSTAPATSTRRTTARRPPPRQPHPRAFLARVETGRIEFGRPRRWSKKGASSFRLGDRNVVPRSRSNPTIPTTPS